MDDNILQKLKIEVKKRNLKYTKQREEVLHIICNSNKHLNAEEIHTQIKDKYPNSTTGIATVYKSLIFLEEANLISSISINNKGKKFEASYKKHHDHLICLNCHKIIEFLDDTIEIKQEEIAKKNNFTLVSHAMYLYGLCEKCNKKK
ncbi:Ferric uptake regulation protein FUR [hydrothermal vent metagenome]|uniref:Ferric uptake regulation protein FUR n=1 Tax=hydrothermal vent metagenome TaxID=652676 RepID=A0A3B1E4B1_9ZZZZ